MPETRQILQVAGLARWTGRGVRVAVIDSGVHLRHPHIQGVVGGVGIDAAGVTHDDYSDRMGHGTAVTAAILEKAPGVDILAVKVFDRDLSTSGDALVAAIDWAVAQRARIVNLSLGTTNRSHADALARAVADAGRVGTWIVAAGPQANMPWLPGSLPGVISVELENSLPRDTCEVALDEGAIRVRASGYPRPIPGVPPERNLRGLSFAVANATGLLARALQDLPDDATIAAALGRAGSSTSPSG
jgi:subtilisin family serine protease